MDSFKKIQYKNIGPGGLECPCCINYPAKNNQHKKLYRRWARRKLKLKYSKNKIILEL